MKISIIIPMYNEEANIKNCVDTLQTECDRQSDWQSEVLLVNDGSKDNCLEMAKELTKDDDRFTVLSYGENHGKGYAVRYGMLHATGDIRVFTDCDLAYGSEAIYKIARKLCDDKADITIGSRAIAKDGYEGYTFMRKLMSKCYLKYVSLVAGFRYSDSQSGIKAFGAKAAQDIFSKCTVDRFAFDLEALMIADKFGYKVSEMGVKVINHNESNSKVNPLRDIMNMTHDIKRIKAEVKALK